jgi:3-methyladenine DNA glycosylase AlkC
MTQEMIDTVIERANEMRKNVEIQKIMMQFSSTKEAESWIIKAAIATLIGVGKQ